MSDWTDEYRTTTYRGPQQYPIPGAWTLGVVEGDGIGWKHFPGVGEDHDHDGEVWDALAPEGADREPGAYASLILEYRDGADALEDPPYHELWMDGELVLLLKGASAVPEGDWWRAIAEALARYDSDEDPATVLPDLGLEHLKADPYGASDELETDPQHDEGQSALGEWSDE